MENIPTHPDQIKEYIRNNWEEYTLLHFDKLQQATAAMIQWPADNKELKKLQFWFKDEKKRSKKMSSGSASTIDKVEQAQKIFVKEEGNILQALVKFKVTDARVDFLKQQVDTNFMVMYDLLKAIQGPPYDIFLEELFDICSGLDDPHSQVLLFIRICALYSDEKIEVAHELVKRTLVELSTRTEDSHAAYGLLKLAYHNEISFDQLPVNTLLAFEEKYILDVSAFIRSLHGKIDFQIAQSLPDTCLIFTQPFFSILRSGGKLLHEGIQPSYLIHLVELISFSFETQLSLVESFVQLFKEGCLTICGWGYDLQPLLQRVVQEEIAQNKIFFGSLKNQIKLFEQLFHLIKENKIPKLLDEQIINELVDFDQTAYQLKRKQYKDMSNNNSDSFTKYIGLFNKANKINNTIEVLPQKAIDIVQKVFEYFNIPALSDIQTTALTLMEQNQIIFQVFGTGTGKTTLALAYMIKLVHVNRTKCFYVNTLRELCSRDFDRIVEVAQSMNINAKLILNQEDLDETGDTQLFFLDAKQYLNIFENKNELIEVLNSAALILDEFDLTLFNKAITQRELSFFTVPKQVLAFTGSPLETYHSNLINKYFGVIPFKYPNFEKINNSSNLCKLEEVYPTRKLQLQKLIDICTQQAQRTPILLILEQEATESFKKMCHQKQIPLSNFNTMNHNEIVSFLDTTFTQKKDRFYHVCILNSTQGRGLDVPSRHDIESAGGITTIIATVPESASEFAQFKGRTNRMGNNGQYYVVLWTKTTSTGNNFLQYHLEVARKEEKIRLNNLFVQKQDVVMEEQKQEKVLKEVKIAEEGIIVMMPRAELKEFEHLESITNEVSLQASKNIDKKSIQSNKDLYQNTTGKTDLALKNSEKKLKGKQFQPDQQNYPFDFKISGKRPKRKAAASELDKQEKRQRISE